MQILLDIDDAQVDTFLELLKNLDFVKKASIKTPLAQLEAKLTSQEQTIWEGIKAGLQDVKQGRVRPARDFLKEINEQA